MTQFSPPVPSVLNTIGGTPVVRLENFAPQGSADLLVKLEYISPTGSYKDRMALAMIEEAEKRGDLRPGMTVVEYTGGSTGSSLAFICAVKGYDCTLVSSDAFALEKLNTMRAFGATLIIEPSVDGKITPDLIPRMIERARQLAESDGVYWTNQFHNTDAVEGYSAIGVELLQQVQAPIDAFCGGVGTAGMLMGVSKAFRAAGAATRLYPLEPATSPVLTKGVAGTHHVEGMGASFVPPMLNREYYYEARAIDEGEARTMARRLARETGIFTGISGGLNVTGALQLAQELGEGHTVVTVVCDTGLKYLAGDLYRDEPL